MRATCPGLLSVGTRVCETPNAPRSRTIDLKYGATGSVELWYAGKALYENTESALKPSANLAYAFRSAIYTDRPEK